MPYSMHNHIYWSGWRKRRSPTTRRRKSIDRDRWHKTICHSVRSYLLSGSSSTRPSFSFCIKFGGIPVDLLHGGVAAQLQKLRAYRYVIPIDIKVNRVSD